MASLDLQESLKQFFWESVEEYTLNLFSIVCSQIGKLLDELVKKNKSFKWPQGVAVLKELRVCFVQKNKQKATRKKK